MPADLRLPAWFTSLAVGVVCLSGCGGSADDEARELAQNSVIAKTNPVREFVVSQADIAKPAPGSPTRAFLQYWANLQFQAWTTAARTYQPGLRRVVGEGLLIRALEGQGPTYLSSRPEIVSTTTNGKQSLIRYLRRSAKEAVPSSITWERDPNGRWLISYDPLLNQALAERRQLDVQQSLDPLSQKPIPAAARAGQSARKLQSQYAGAREAARAASTAAPADTGP